MFREMMDLHRELVPNRRIQAHTKTRKMAIAEVASAKRSPIGPVGALDAAGVDPEEQKQQTVEGQEA